MESIERMAPPSQLELDGSDTYIVTMREFLDKPRIARDFQDLKADAQRLDSIGREGDLLKAGAAEAELEAGKLARTHDEHRQHRLGFRVGVLLAAFFVALDALPANLAAQAFGLDVVPTWGITAVIVGALGAGMCGPQQAGLTVPVRRLPARARLRRRHRHAARRDRGGAALHRRAALLVPVGDGR